MRCHERAHMTSGCHGTNAGSWRPGADSIRYRIETSCGPKIVLLAAQGLENTVISDRLDLPRPVVSKWRKRFFEERLPGLEERPRTGRPTVFPPSRGRAGEGARL